MIDGPADGNPKKRTTEEAKKALEKKITELEGKLSELSSHLGEKPHQSSGITRISNAEDKTIPPREGREITMGLHKLEEYEREY